MNKIWRVFSKEDIDKACDLGFKQVLLSCLELSRQGQLSKTQVVELCKYAQEKKLMTTLDWDTLVSVKRWPQAIELVEAIKGPWINAIKILDPGVLRHAREHWDFDIHLNLEHGHHNLEAIKAWATLAGPKLTRLCLSLELTFDELKPIALWAQSQNLQLEVQILGKILLFYTPRSLLSPLGLSSHAIADSEEGAHKGFPVEENLHGTLMYNTKDLGLYPSFDQLIDLGIDWGRVELQGEEACQLLEKMDLLPWDEFKGLYKEVTGRSLWGGHLRGSKTDVLFSKLKNKHLQKGPHFVGQVIDAKKGELCALLLQKEITLSSPKTSWRFVTPEGKEKKLEVEKIQDSKGQVLNQAHEGQMIFIKTPWALPCKSAAYFEEA